MGKVTRWITIVLLCFTLNIKDANLSKIFTVAFFQYPCRFNVSEALSSSALMAKLVNDYDILTICVVDKTSLDKVFSDAGIELFVGSLNYDYNRELFKYAELAGRPFLSPYSEYPPSRTDNYLSTGPSLSQTAMAVKTILTHFRWKHVIIIVELERYWTSVANNVFIYLSEGGFEPIIKYIQVDSSESEIIKVIDGFTTINKVITLCVSSSLKIRILKLAADKQIYEHHAFFTFTKGPYSSLHIDDMNELKDNHSAILESVFVIHPVFKQSPSVDRRRRSNTRSDVNNQYETGSRPIREKRNSNTITNLEFRFISDAVILLEHIVNSAVDKSDIDANRFFEAITNMTLSVYSGEMVVNSNRESVYDFVLYDFDVNKWEYVKVQELFQLSDGSWEIIGVSNILWPNGVKLEADACFLPDSCQSHPGLDALYILAIAIAVLFVAAVATGVVITVWRKVIHKEMLKGHNKVLLTNDDLVFLRRKDVLKGSSKILNGTMPEKPDLLKVSEKPNRSLASLHEHAEITETARYNGDLVHVKQLKVKGFEMKTKVLNIIKSLRDIRHENVNAVLGFYDTVQPPSIISDYCMRGSLEDVLHNKDIKLDWDFKVSLLTDLIRGIRYIHNSAIRFHGNLKSRNCVIDSRWVLKVTDFGLAGVYETSKASLTFNDRDLLFTAPEHLKHPVPALKGSEKADVYSIAIIMQCVVLRSDPYSTSGLRPAEILLKLRHPPPLLRPSVSHGTAPPQYIQIMKVCWSENPDLRPTIEEIYQQFKTITGGKKMNIVDTMFRMLEKYSTDLEELVKDRTLQLEEEKKKTDVLLYRMLPPIVADSLKIGQPVAAETFSEVTIYFSDIVGFTTISANSTPMQVVDLLNGLYTMFDATIDSYDVYKVETIGDAYMVCSGLPIRNGNRHAGEICTMALDLLSQCGNFTIKHMPEVPLRVRIGLHSGSCVAGVVGLTMPRFCLFGDTVNTASRMESTGAAYRIHISEQVKTILDVIDVYYTEYRGEVELKGKGMAKTYWLTGKKGLNKTLPEPANPKSGDNHGLSLEEFKFGPGRKASTVATPTTPLIIGVKGMPSPMDQSKHLKTYHKKDLKTSTQLDPITGIEEYAIEDIDNTTSSMTIATNRNDSVNYRAITPTECDECNNHVEFQSDCDKMHNKPFKRKRAERNSTDSNIVTQKVIVHAPISSDMENTDPVMDETITLSDRNIEVKAVKERHRIHNISTNSSKSVDKSIRKGKLPEKDRYSKQRRKASQSINDETQIHFTFEESLV